MKLDKIAFAVVVNFINQLERPMDGHDINLLDELIDVQVPEPQVVRPSNDAIESLMAQMAAGTNMIDAIRSYRAITGMGLKESKDTVERYWINVKPNSYTYSELKAKLNDDKSYSPDEVDAIISFLNKL